MSILGSLGYVIGGCVEKVAIHMRKINIPVYNDAIIVKNQMWIS